MRSILPALTILLLCAACAEDQASAADVANAPVDAALSDDTTANTTADAAVAKDTAAANDATADSSSATEDVAMTADSGNSDDTATVDAGNAKQDTASCAEGKPCLVDGLWCAPGTCKAGVCNSTQSKVFVKEHSASSGVELYGVAASTSTLVAAGAVLDSDGNADLHIVATDTFGKQLWTKTLGGKGIDIAMDVANGSTDTFLVVGSTDDTTKSVDNGWGLAVTAAGKVSWQLKWGGDVPTVANAVHVENVGGSDVVVVAGRQGIGNAAQGHVTNVTGGQIKWQASFGDQRADTFQDIIYNNLHYVAVGATRKPDGKDRPWIVAMDNLGKKTWTAQLEGQIGSAHAVTAGATFSPLAPVFVAGDDGKGAGWLARYDKAGKQQWLRKLPFGRIRSAALVDVKRVAVVGRIVEAGVIRTPLAIYNSSTGVRIAGAAHLPSSQKSAAGNQEVEALAADSAQGWLIVAGRRGTSSPVGFLGRVAPFGSDQCNGCAAKKYGDCDDGDPCSWHSCAAGICQDHKMAPGEHCK